MKYFEIINSMLNKSEYGFINIVSSNQEFKDRIIAEIKKAKCSVVTARIFLDFIELKLNEQTSVDMSETMLESAVFVGNGCGLDPCRYSEYITAEDMQELKAINNFKTR